MYEYEIKNGIRQKDLLVLKGLNWGIRSYIKEEMNGKALGIQESKAMIRARRVKKTGLFREHHNTVQITQRNFSEPGSN